MIDLLRARLGDADGTLALSDAHGQTTLELEPSQWLATVRVLRDAPELAFEQLIDLCGVDYLTYGKDEWETSRVTATGFSRGVHGTADAGRLRWTAGAPSTDGAPQVAGPLQADATPSRRFAVVVHLLSIRHNRRLRLRCFADEAFPVVPSLVDLWPVADWFEREAFDLFGIIFEGHPDLRRLLTDYGFVGHPFRKDFPLIGNVEVRFDAERKRVVYEPVTIEPRVLVPRVIREDSRWEQSASELPVRHTPPQPALPASTNDSADKSDPAKAASYKNGTVR